MQSAASSVFVKSLVLAASVALLGCDGNRSPATSDANDRPSPTFRNVATATAYVGDSACASCHATQATAYGQHAMARSFHRWTAGTRVETTLDSGIINRPTGFAYRVIDSGGRLYQVESVTLPNGERLHELRRPIDYVMGSGQVARSYFTEENGRLYQLPLTWYKDHGWDFSPGYELHNARFDRTMPDRCVSCHASYPTPIAHLEAKFADVKPGIGCERCHGPGALHVEERRAGIARTGAFDSTIVNPTRLPLERRVDVCEQCHVHTAVNVLREGRSPYDFIPSQRLSDTWAFFKTAGSIDVVSHADRLKQSACFIASRDATKPLECATCHDPHQAPLTKTTRSTPCLACHQPTALAKKVSAATRAEHAATSDCVSCHMPRIQERTVPHGTFTEHWIRKQPSAEKPVIARRGDEVVEPYFARDRAGDDGAIYRAMGGIVHASLATDSRQLSTAASALQNALGTSTDRPNAHFLLGVALQQTGKAQDAVKALERSVHADSSNPEALRALGKAYETTGAAPASIEGLYRRALTVQPALGWIRAEYADFLQAHGRRDDAEREYRAALAETPALSTAWFNYGATLAEAGKTVEASSAFAEAVQREPALAQGVSSLLVADVVSGTTIRAIEPLGIRVASPLVRPGPPRAPGLIPTSPGEAPAVVLIGAPPRSSLMIFAPDGALVRRVPPGDGPPRWDLRSDGGTIVASGLYRVRVLARDAGGGMMPPRQLAFGFVRRNH